MKIICIGRNYKNHIKELESPYPDNPVFFLKPESAILRNGKDFFIPSFSNEIHYELEIIIKINRLGKHIQERFAHRYFKEISLGIDFTARDLQNKCKNNGLPWEISKCFDSSAAIGDFIPIDQFKQHKDINFYLLKNREMVQKANANQMIFSFNKIISYISKFMTLKIGDLIFTGTPAGVGKVEINDELRGFLNEKELLNIRIK